MSENRRFSQLGGERAPRILICEDEPLLAMDLDQVVRDAGGEVCGLASDQEKAVEFLEAVTPDAVILDVELSDGACTRLAELLIDRQIPFLIVTGLTKPEGVPPELAAAPWLLKPLQTPELITKLNELLSGK